MSVAVIGAGAFGTALAAVATLSGRAEVTLITRDNKSAANFADSGRNDARLPGIDLPAGLLFSADPAVVGRASTVLFAMPSQAQRSAARQWRPYLHPSARIVCCAKGIETSTGQLLSDILETELPGHEVFMLSGPGFAADIARGLPTAMVLAGRDLENARLVAQRLSGPSFRLYASTDPVGVQLGGALKNVLAIAAGITEGAGLGESARAALIARGLAEMSRLIIAMGGEAETVAGLSGLGDLVLTATSRQSRNYRYGLMLGQGAGKAPPGELVEGVHAAAIAVTLADRNGIDMPVARAVTAILEGHLDIPTAMTGLMARPITTE